MNNSNSVFAYIVIIFLFCTITTYGQTPTVIRDSLRHIELQEVVVTATQPDAPGSRSVVGQDAIRHIQATDLSGLSQLLPGVLTRNPNLNAPTGFTIRSATYENATNALGTAILIDGVRMNNNTNLQQMGLEGKRTLFNSTVLSGFDVRSLSPASIESAELIRGVPSARYGDVTSGVVLIKSKAGVQPLTVGLRFTATEKIASVGKGISIGKKGGALYLGADYALSTQAPERPEESFHRIAIQAAYAKDFTDATLRLNLRAFRMKDNDQRGNNTIEGEYQKLLNQGFSFSANGQWDLMKSWITNLEYQASFSYGHQKNESSTYYSGTQRVTTNTTQAGEQAGIFLSPNYFSQLSVEGKPLNANASLIANWRRAFQESLFNHLQLGIEANTEGNRGKGIVFDPTCPPMDMLQMRPRSYSSIPFVSHFAVFAENQLTLRTGRMRTELQTGIRITQLQNKAIHYAPSADPRINIRQVLIDRKEDVFLSRLSIRAGWGLLHKMPMLAYLFPDQSYIDKSCFTYNDAENGNRLAVMHTFVTDRTFNPDLRLPVNRKFELGLNFRIAGVTADIVWYNEHLKNGYSTVQEAEPFTYRRYATLTEKGQRPELTANGVVNNGEAVDYTSTATFATYTRPQNGIEQKKQGVEYTIGPIRFPALRSSLLVNGSYLNVREKDDALTAYHPQIEINGKPYPYVGIYEASSSVTNLQVWEQLSTRFQCITQLPQIGLITSITLQAVWVDKHRRGMESSYNNPVYLADDNGNRIEGSPQTDTQYTKRLNPVYYMDGEDNLHPFTAAMATDHQYADLVINANTPTVFQQDSYSPYFLFNLRITKEIGRHASIAFCANNLTGWNPKRYSNSSQKYTILNPDLYYGAEVSIRF